MSIATRHEAALIRDAISLAIRASVKSRDQIAEEMTAILGVNVTRRALDSYTAESADQNRFPLEYATAFCTVLNDWDVLSEVVERAGFRMIPEEDAKLLELGRAYAALKSAEKAVSL